jgi:hypothetical protein
MFLAAEETPFVLQGPKPPIPPATWESVWLLALVTLALVALAVFAIRRFLRAAPGRPAPLAQLDLDLRRAEALPATEAVAQATLALRAYLAAVEPRAAPSLSTEELLAVLSGLPVFLPARQPLLAALRSADAAKFAGATLEPSLLIAGIREAARRIEDARRTFARPPVVMVSTGSFGGVIPVPPAGTPPLPGPPPLPRKDRA